jgi:ligand-binding sensor domain-containing protein
MPKLIKSLFLLFSYLTIQYNCLAQTPVYKQYNTENGLAGNTVYSILYDNEGFIWLGTDYGVSRFDGKDFVNYTLANGLSDIQILKIKQDSKGRIWFLGFNGTVSYWYKGKIFNASSDSTLKEIVSENSFKDLYEDDEHDLWFSSLLETLIYRSPKIIHKFSGYPSLIMNSSKGYLYCNVHFRRIIDKKKKTYNHLKLNYGLVKDGAYTRLGIKKALFISNNGVIYQNDTIQKLIIPFNKTFNNIRISNMLLTKDSLLFLSAIGKGLYCYNLKNTNAVPIIYLKNKLVNDVTTDGEGNIWATTLNEGIFMIPNYSNMVSLYAKESGINDDKILALSKQKNDLIIGVFPNKLYSLNDKILKPMYIAIKQSNNKLIQIKSNDQNIWISLEYGLLQKTNNTSKYIYNKNLNKNRKVVNVKDMFIGKKELLMATANGLITYSLSNNMLAKRITPGTFRVYSTFEDFNGIIW